MRASLPSLVLLTTSCATLPSTPPPPSRALTTGTVAEAFGCAMRQVNDLGYLVADADREAGFIRAERDHTGLGDALLGGVENYDQLTVTIFPQADARVVLRVVAGGFQVQQRGENAGSRISWPSSDGTAGHVQTILEGCGQPITPVANAGIPSDQGL